MKPDNNNLLDWALYYRKIGWSIFPVGGDKKPLIPWTEYQTKFATDKELNRWFSDPNTKGIAVVTGRLSELVVLDIDVAKGAKTEGMHLLPVPTVKTGGGGWHYYYQYPKDKEIRNSAGIVGEHIDIRAEGGYVVAPPSLHPSGNLYEWCDVLSPDEIGVEEIPKWLLEKTSLFNESKINLTEIINGVSEGRRNESATSLIGKLLPYLPKNEWENLGWQFLLTWNKSNKPPLPEIELKTTFLSIANAEIQKRGNSKIETEWTPPISILELCKKDFPEKKWVVENIFERETIGQLSAAPNQWKTWLMWYMAICIATGKKVFDKFEVDKQGVMIVNEEDTEMMLKERTLMLLSEIEDIPIYIHAEKGIKLKDETTARLLEEVKEKKVEVVIFDSLSVIHTADENSATEMGAVFEQMKKFTREGITVLFTNHHRKKSLKKWEQDDLQEQVRGSTVINAVPSGHITCEEKIQDNEKFIIIRQAKLKGAEKLTPFLVRIKKEEGRIDFIYEGAHEESLGATTKLKNELYKIIRASELWLGVKDFMEMVSKSGKPIRDQLGCLGKDKQIQVQTRATLKKRGIPVPVREKESGQEFLYLQLDRASEEPEDIKPNALFDVFRFFT